MDERTKLARSILRCLSENNIEYVVLRNSDELFTQLGHDIDLGVPSYSIPRFNLCLKRLFKRLDLEILKTQKRAAYSCYVFFDKQNRFFLKIDTWGKVDYRGLKVFDISQLMENSHTEQGIRIASKTDQLITTMIKEILYNKSLKAKHIFRIQELYDANNKKRIQDELEHLVGRYFAKRINNALENKQLRDLQNEYKKIRRFCLKTAFWEKPFRAILSHLTWFKDQMRSFLFPGGLFMVLIGPDGSGKSTLSNSLRNELEYQLFNRVRYYHGHFEILPRLKNVMAKLKGKKSVNINGENQTSVKPHNPFKASLYILYYGLDYFLGLFASRFFKSKNDLVLFDRYFYDYEMQPIWKHAPKWLLTLVSFFVPKPDLYIFLFANPENIHNRKPELSVEQIRDQQKVMRKLMERLNPYIVVDTNQDLKDSTYEIIEKMVGILKERGFGL